MSYGTSNGHPPRQKLGVAVLGATGTVGQRFIQLLADHPWFTVTEVAASERSAGKPYEEACQWKLPGAIPADVARLKVLPLEAAFTAPIIMSALPGEVAKYLEPALAAAGHLVSSNTSANRMGQDIPLLLPEINADHVRLIDAQRARGWAGGLVTMSNCTIVGVVMALAPLRRFGIERVNLVSMQAISGAGYPGVSSFDILDNVIPYIGGEEDKAESEPKKILGALAEGEINAFAMDISAACHRVPVMDGHTVAVSVGFRQRPTEAEIRQAWETFSGHPLSAALPSHPAPVIAYVEESDRPQPRRDRDSGRGMTTTIGRLRPCSVLDYKFVTLSHNTIRGAAGGAILNAELLVMQGYASHFETATALEAN
ncbi:MAG TPA: aspartate-semialdehyde dehydrogenase [Aggregatilineales bacterium]|nr:aspartate-semialdehyde dehydrogenase [Anaerolineales bacterium]HRE47199.1 aspartate-semialdehyde dehydrogenase [Aggregatilineales bacterium]